MGVACLHRQSFIWQHVPCYHLHLACIKEIVELNIKCTLYSLMFGIIMKTFAYVSHNKGVEMAALQKLVAVCALKSKVTLQLKPVPCMHYPY